MNYTGLKGQAGIFCLLLGLYYQENLVTKK